MIPTECATFAAMFVAGGMAGVVARALLALGSGSRIARAVFDSVTPFVVGAIWVYALYLSAGGVFRSYRLVAYLLGVGSSQYLLRRYSPILRKLSRKVILPVKACAEGVERRASAWTAPLRERVSARRRRRAEVREEKRLAARTNREKRERERARAASEKAARRSPSREKEKRLRATRRRASARPAGVK